MIVIECTGDGRSRGRMHGEAARGLIRDGLQRWADATAAAAGIPITRYVSAFLSDTALLAAIETRLPDLVEEMRGIAEGAGVPFDQVAAYNLMDEQWWYDLERTPNAEPGCSVVAFADQGTGAVLLGQNMDLPAYMDGGQVVLRIQAPGGVGVVCRGPAGPDRRQQGWLGALRQHASHAPAQPQRPAGHGCDPRGFAS
jgi:hypothetical protein